jgi:DNA-binding response OmpR family regulator
MAGTGPSILVIADDWRERELIVSTLRGAGFATVSAIPGSHDPTLARERFTAAVIAWGDEDAAPAMAELRALHPDLPVVLVVDPMAPRAFDEDCATLVKHPLDPGRLLGCVVELVLRTEDGPAAAPRHNTAAELSIATARLACLYNRHSAAAATGAARLAHDLKRQIGEVRSTCRGLAAASGGLAVGGCAG